jgi:tRNA modification GTPase
VFSTDDTIVAVATPPGRGGIGVVRLSGPEAHAIARTLTGRGAVALQPRHATLARVVSGSEDARGAAFDQVICTWFPAPLSYTGEARRAPAFDASSTIRASSRDWSRMVWRCRSSCS